MRLICARTGFGTVIFGLFMAATAAAQTVDKVDYFPDSIAEKEDHLVRLSGGSSWLLANRTSAVAPVDVMVVMRDVIVGGKSVPAAWLYIAGEEIPARHVEGVYARNPAIITRVVASEDQGTKLRLADGTSLLVPGYNKYISNRWVLPYRALLTDNRLTLYNLADGRRISVQPAK